MTGSSILLAFCDHSLIHSHTHYARARTHAHTRARETDCPPAADDDDESVEHSVGTEDVPGEIWDRLQVVAPAAVVGGEDEGFRPTPL